MITAIEPIAPTLANLADPGPAFDAAIEARRPGTAPPAAGLDPAGYAYHKKPTHPAAYTLALTARHPWDEAGFIDGYQVGRWDSSTDTIYMDPIVQTGPSPGQWEGSVLYGTFKAPAAGTYEIRVTFYGWQITLRLSSPSGASLGTSLENAPVTVTGQMTLAAGQGQGFSINCTGLYLGFVQKVEIVAV